MKMKGKSKGKPGKKLPFGGKQAPPFGMKEGSKREEAGESKRQEAAEVRAGKSKGKK